jgi:hypothetical protein
MSLAINGIPTVSARIHLPKYGQWVCEAQLDDPGDGSFAALISGGIATLSIDTRSMTVSDSAVGRIVSAQSQTIGLLGSLVFTAGRGIRLSDTIGERSYHDESGVNVATALGDILTDSGHTLTGTVTSRLQGKHFLRERAPASRALTALLGKQWTFDLAGNMHAPLVNTSFPEFDLISTDTGNQSCVLALDNLKDPRGAKVTQLGKIVESATVTIDQNGIRAECQLGEMSLTTIIEAMVEAVIARKVLAPQLYRVHSMADSGRVNLQPYEATSGLPDLINVLQYPGVAGAAPELNAGQVVMVQFIGNDRTKPIITGYIGAGDGHVSASVVINGSGAVAARVGDPVSVGPFVGQTITLGAEGASGFAPLGAPIPFKFGLPPATPSPEGLDTTKLNGEITSSTSSVRL